MAALALGATALAAAGCGGSTSAPSNPNSPVTLLMGERPNSLDPAVAYTPQALEPDWLVYTPLISYQHSDGVPGTRLIPGLAEAMPVVSDGGLTYSLTLHPGLSYSNGEPVRASDFAWAVERAIKLHWRGAQQLITSRVEGASAFAFGRAKSISGIQTDNATGQITIHLIAPYGAIENVLALPATAPVPSGTPMANESSHPPPGVGSYEFARVGTQSFWLVRNPLWRAMSLPGIPAGHVDVHVKITGDPGGNAMAVLNNSADVFDWADQIPPTLIPQVEREASHRYSRQVVNATYLIFMDVTRKPFSSQLVRQAVRLALDKETIRQLASGTVRPGCYLIPPGMYGHAQAQCPEGPPTGGGNISQARVLIGQSGMAGTRVTVWSGADSPFKDWMAYYTSLLNQIGLRASQKVIPDGSYFATVGKLSLHPQTGFGEFYAAFPNPADFFQWFTASAIQATGNQNWSEIADSYVDRQVRILSTVPAVNLSAVSSFWKALDQYMARRAYVAVFGYQSFPQFVSDRLKVPEITFSPVFGLDWSSFRLK